MVWLMRAISKVSGVWLRVRRAQKEGESLGRAAKNWAAASGVSSLSLGVRSSRIT